MLDFWLDWFLDGLALIQKTDLNIQNVRFYKSNKLDYALIISRRQSLRNPPMAHIQKFVTYNQKTLKKTCSYYIMHIAIALLVGYFVTGSIWMALTLSLLEPTIQAIAFFFHEKVWEKNASTLQKNQHMTV